MKPPLRIDQIGKGLDEYFSLRVRAKWMKDVGIDRDARLKYAYGHITFGREGNERDLNSKSYYIMRGMEAQKAGRSMGAGEFCLEPTKTPGEFKIIPVKELELAEINKK